MKIGDIVIRKDDMNKLGSNKKVIAGMIVQITKSKTIFIMWPNQFYKTGCNDYSFNDRYVVISEQN